VALERQPLLVELCNHAARARGLDLRAEDVDATTGIGPEGGFDLAACISVVEHVPPAERRSLLRNAARALRPGGLLYLTFDYGTHVARAPYGQGPADSPDEALADLEPLCATLLEGGLSFVENDPRELPEEVRARKTAPGHVATARRMALNRPPYDAETPWSEVGRYLGRRLLGLGRTPPTRYASHNFFRLFLRRRG
jgi:SAM-dependent methyltransferase